MRFFKKPNGIYIFSFFLLVVFFLFLFLFVSMKVFLQTDRFKKIITNELIFLLSADNIQIDYEKIRSHGFITLNFSHVKLTSRYNDELLLDLANLHVEASFMFSPLAIKYTFYGYVNDSTDLMGVYTAYWFKELQFSKDQSDSNASAGDLILNANHIPLRFVTGLYRSNLSPMIWDQWNADLTGTIVLTKHAPYHINTSDIQANLKFNNPSLNYLNSHSQKSLIHFSSFKTEWIYKYPRLEIQTPFTMNSQEFPGNLNVNGGLIMDESYQPQLDLKIKGSDGLFTLVKNIFLCPSEREEVTLRGFKTISCM